MCAITIDEDTPFLIGWYLVSAREHRTEHGVRVPGERAQRGLKFASTDIQLDTLLEAGQVCIDDCFHALQLCALAPHALLLRAQAINGALQGVKVERGVRHLVSIAFRAYKSVSVS